MISDVIIDIFFLISKDTRFLAHLATPGELMVSRAVLSVCTSVNNFVYTCSCKMVTAEVSLMKFGIRVQNIVALRVLPCCL